MDALTKIEQIINSDLLISDLCFIPSRGASIEDIQKEEEKIGYPFSSDHKTFLMK